MLFNNKINITKKNKTIHSFIFTLFILNKKITIYMVTSWMVIQSLSIARNPQELQVVTTRDLIV